MRIWWALLLISWVGLAFAQNGDRPPRVTLGMGATTAITDLTEPGEAFRRFVPGVNLGILFDGDRPLKLAINAGYNSFVDQRDARPLTGQEGIVPNNYVLTRFIHADLRLTYRFFHRGRLNPWLGLGLGGMSFGPVDASGNSLGDNFLTRLPEETYGTFAAYFPLAAGLDFRVNRLLTLGLEYTYRPTTSDYLDNVGQLGDRDGNDRLHMFQLSMGFTFHKPKKPVPPAPGATPAIVDYEFVRVYAHEKLAEIAERYQTTPEVLRRINHLYKDEITMDTWIKVPKHTKR